MTSGPSLTARLTGLRMVLIALVVGVVLISGGMAFSAIQMNIPMVQDQTVAYGLVGMAFLMFVAGLFVMPVVLKAQRPARVHPAIADDSRLFAIFSSEVFLSAAIIEAPGILSAVGFFLTREYAFLLLTGLTVVVLLITLPSERRWNAWREAAIEQAKNSSEIST
ncbi:MAG: hypothetical protein ACRCZF_12530 [Gemmataceae bacterium]